eukprot:scaffold35877_cov183-Skeletonema_dohrnii-CCMP3373.AAC.2
MMIHSRIVIVRIKTGTTPNTTRPGPGYCITLPITSLVLLFRINAALVDVMKDWIGVIGD